MPIYEYQCNSCQRKVSVLVRGFNATVQATCTHCGSKDLKRLISAVTYHRSEADRMADFQLSDTMDPSFYKDSRNVGLWAKKRLQQLGSDVPSEVEEIVERGRSGELLKEMEPGPPK